MRTAVVLAAVAALLAVAACSKKSSLYLDPGRLAGAPAPAKPPPASTPSQTPSLEKASQVEPPAR